MPVLLMKKIATFMVTSASVFTDQVIVYSDTRVDLVHYYYCYCYSYYYYY